MIYRLACEKRTGNFACPQTRRQRYRYRKTVTKKKGRACVWCSWIRSTRRNKSPRSGSVGVGKLAKWKKDWDFRDYKPRSALLLLYESARSLPKNPHTGLGPQGLGNLASPRSRAQSAPKRPTNLEKRFREVVRNQESSAEKEEEGEGVVLVVSMQRVSNQSLRVEKLKQTEPT